MTSALAGYRKPHPAIFARVARVLNLAPAQIGYIGDSYEADYLGASRAGFTACLLLRPKDAKVAALTKGVRAAPDLPGAILALHAAAYA